MIGEVVRAILFGACISLTALGTRSYGNLSELGPRDIPLQPPDWVFGVVWPCLYVTTGFAWVLQGNKADIPLGIITFLCCSWLIAYLSLRQKKLAAIILVCTAITTTITAFVLGGTPGGLLVPLAVWTTFASYLNLYEVIR